MILESKSKQNLALGTKTANKTYVCFFRQKTYPVIDNNLLTYESYFFSDNKDNNTEVKEVAPVSRTTMSRSY